MWPRCCLLPSIKHDYFVSACALSVLIGRLLKTWLLCSFRCCSISMWSAVITQLTCTKGDQEQLHCRTHAHKQPADKHKSQGSVLEAVPRKNVLGTFDSIHSCMCVYEHHIKLANKTNFGITGISVHVQTMFSSSSADAAMTR